jgi:hypothetical protein
MTPVPDSYKPLVERVLYNMVKSGMRILDKEGVEITDAILERSEDDNAHVLPEWLATLVTAADRVLKGGGLRADLMPLYDALANVPEDVLTDAEISEMVSQVALREIVESDPTGAARDLIASRLEQQPWQNALSIAHVIRSDEGWVV